MFPVLYQTQFNNKSYYKILSYEIGAWIDARSAEKGSTEKEIKNVRENCAPI